MAKQTKALSGPAKRKFLQAIVDSEAGIDSAAGGRLTERLDRAIAQVRARQHPALGSGAASAPAGEVALPTQKSKSSTQPPSFDPHAFSVIVVMSKQGAAGLLKRLEAVSEATDLRAIAHAQHLDVPDGVAEPAALRTAIVEATARRIADRRAAAS